MVEVIGLTVFAGIFCTCLIIIPSFLEKLSKKELCENKLSET